MGKRFSKILKGQIATSVFYILFGVCLILMPVKTLDVICKVVFGLVLIGAGCYHVYIYVREKENATILDLFSGVIVLVLGGFLFINPQIVVKLLPLLLGAFVLVDSIWTLQGCLKLKKRQQGVWKAFLIGSLVFILLGIAMVLNPFPGVKYTMIFAGWVFLCNGVTDVVFLILLRKGLKELAEAETEETETEETEEKQEPEESETEPAGNFAEAAVQADAQKDERQDSSSGADGVALPDLASAPEAGESSEKGEISASKTESEASSPKEEPLEEWKD